MYLVIADIHIKLGQKGVPKEWALNRYKMFFEQVDEIERNVDKIIIPGDIFDRIPTMEELNVYFEFIFRRKKPTIISTGNHEATKKGRTFFTELKEVTQRINPLVTIVADQPEYYGGFYVVPYEVIKDKKMWEELKPLPIFTHVRGEIPPHVKPEIPLEWLDKFPVVFAGDLHSHSNTQRNIVYPGSPMTTSFHRKEVETGYLLVDPDDWTWTWHKFELPQLIRKTVSDESEMIPTKYHHTIYEFEGNVGQLSIVSNSELLDKKIVKRVSDVALVLDPSMTIREELKEWLLYIQDLEEEEAAEVLGEFDEINKTKTG